MNFLTCTFQTGMLELLLFSISQTRENYMQQLWVPDPNLSTVTFSQNFANRQFVLAVRNVIKLFGLNYGMFVLECSDPGIQHMRLESSVPHFIFCKHVNDPPTSPSQRIFQWGMYVCTNVQCSSLRLALGYGYINF